MRTLTDGSVPFEILEYIPEESALHYHFAPIGLKNGMLEVGIVDPDNMEARDALNFLAAKKNIPYKIFLISPDDFTIISRKDGQRSVALSPGQIAGTGALIADHVPPMRDSIKPW